MQSFIANVKVILKKNLNLYKNQQNHIRDTAGFISLIIKFLFCTKKNLTE